MNNSKIFVIAIAVLLVVAVLIELSVPKRFNWEATFRHNSVEPFACKLFDSLATTSMKNGYSVIHSTFYQLRKRNSKTPCSIIKLYDNYYNAESDLEFKSMLGFVADGNKLLFCANDYAYELLDTLQLNMETGYFSPSFFKKSSMYGLLNNIDTLLWDKDSAYERQTYTVYSSLCESHFKLGADTTLVPKDDIQVDTAYVEDTDVDEIEVANVDYDTIITKTSEAWKPLAWKFIDGKKVPILMKRQWGNGEIVVCTTPLLLTNYGIMDGKNVGYVYRVLGTISDNPVVRIVDKDDEATAENSESMSPMRFFIGNPPLRWATYIALLALLLFMIFTARRRQRAIPVVQKPENHQLEFAKLIGTLYYQEGIHGDLVRKKYIFFAEHLRRETQVDIDNDAEDDDNFGVLARHTGMPQGDISARIKTVRRACRSGMSMTSEEMMMYVDYMNDIISKI
ncbi:MAG: DUF4350 domain-containing protein [Prevotella sp.]|uniref:DUF4350 domain-containing protein n=1 Tax=Prevotella sp. TaxID=59823 RepID=UPI002A2D5564|nr:DUF4350 domain-containing protein [Prevotella sp.]MDD7317565.1 DUF4350 domain-containing protein [Prevotellaceae bacterium]MDY4020588.1 DUF4350 domain-containing protein [Prevotella sp.]